MRTVIRNTNSSWRKVTSGIRQGSVWAPAMLQKYGNGITEDVRFLRSYINSLADDAKLIKVMINEKDCREVQKGIDKIHASSQRWKLEFNARKCHALGIRNTQKETFLKLLDRRINNNENCEEKVLEVMIQGTLSPERHINGTFGFTYSLLSIITVAFNYLDKEIIKKNITSMIRPKLASAVCMTSCSSRKGHNKINISKGTAHVSKKWNFFVLWPTQVHFWSTSTAPYSPGRAITAHTERVMIRINMCLGTKSYAWLNNELHEYFFYFSAQLTR